MTWQGRSSIYLFIYWTVAHSAHEVLSVQHHVLAQPESHFATHSTALPLFCAITLSRGDAVPVAMLLLLCLSAFTRSPTPKARVVRSCFMLFPVAL